MEASKKEIVKGKGKILFEKDIAIATIRSPLEGFKLVQQKIERRYDPLLKIPSRINALRAERVKQAILPGENFEANLQKIVEASSKKCFFCSNFLKQSTPKFPEELTLEERISIGDIIVFPNLFVFSQNHAVVTLGSKHFTNLPDFSPAIWRDAILGSIKYFKAVYKLNPELKFPSINFNFLPPSASSIIHPHIQIILDDKPTYLTDLLLTKSQDYYNVTTTPETKGRNYWLDLLESERELDQRFITENDFMTWTATFSPIGKDELTGIIKIPKTDITKFSDEEVGALAEELVQVFRALYHGRGVTAVNMALYCGPINESLEKFYRLNLRIISRPTLMPNYTNDTGFMELLHREPIAAASPEMIARDVRKHLKS